MMHTILRCENSQPSRDFDGGMISVPCGGEATGVLFFPDWSQDPDVDEMITGSLLVCDRCGPEVVHEMRLEVEWLMAAQLSDVTVVKA